MFTHRIMEKFECSIHVFPAWLKIKRIKKKKNDLKHCKLPRNADSCSLFNFTDIDNLLCDIMHVCTRFKSMEFFQTSSNPREQTLVSKNVFLQPCTVNPLENIRDSRPLDVAGLRTGGGTEKTVVGIKNRRYDYFFRKYPDLLLKK